MTMSRVGERGDQRAWTARAKRLALDLTLVLSLMIALPLLESTTWLGRWQPTEWAFRNWPRLLRRLEPARQLVLPVDPSITPLAAGRSLVKLAGPDFRAPQSGEAGQSDEAAAAGWKKPVLTSTMRNLYPQWGGVPGSEKIFENSRRGFSAEEMRFLQQLDAAPVWHDFDRVARAPAIDVLGTKMVEMEDGRAAWWEARFSGHTQFFELTEAAVARAAYRLALGQRDTAEIMLRAIVSVGLNMIDNSVGLGTIEWGNLPGSVMGDQSWGVSVAVAGRNALEQFYGVLHDPREAVLRAQRLGFYSWTPRDSAARMASQKVLLTREQVLEQATDPAARRSVRFASLQVLAFSQCSNVRDLLFGHRADVINALEQAKHDLVRYPSDLAFINMLEQAPPPAIDEQDWAPFLHTMSVAASTAAGVLLHSSRLSACSALATRGRFHFRFGYE